MSAGYDDSAVARLDYHGSMLTDRVRIEAFMRAIMAAVEPGDVVVDIGTGTGVLALFAAKAGAGTVYAIEQERIIDLARQIVAANGYEDRIVLIPGTSTDIELPELGDVLVTETIGNAALDEGILTWVSDARSRLLKPEATIIPSKVSLMAAALELPRDAAEWQRWARPMHSLDFAPLRRLMVNSLYSDELSPVSVVAEAVEVFTSDFSEQPTDVKALVHTEARRDATVHAIGLWFEAELGPDIRLSNAPPSPVASWNQGVLMLEQPVTVAAGDTVAIEVGVTGNGRSWSWRVGDGPRQSTPLESGGAV